MAKSRFTKPFTQQEPIPQSGIDDAVELLATGRLHRYNTIAGEAAAAAVLEREFAAYMGQRYCLACTSGGYALHIALKAAGIRAGEPVLTNAFTLAPVPGAIDNAGGKPVFVEIDENYCVDLEHLESMMQKSGARFFMISHMRGHIADMDAVVNLCERYGVTLIEDCAHTMGARWNGKRSGSFGKIACFSTQTYKHMNSGEGGLLTTDDDEIIARAIIYSSIASTISASIRRITADAWITCAPPFCWPSCPNSNTTASAGTRATRRCNRAWLSARKFNCRDGQRPSIMSAVHCSFASSPSMTARSRISSPPAVPAASN